ncbi:unnamed protein product, partial [Amoebophrya sp. A120]|eukprot:GSA120T00016098001.1
MPKKPSKEKGGTKNKRSGGRGVITGHIVDDNETEAIISRPQEQIDAAAALDEEPQNFDVGRSSPVVERKATSVQGDTARTNELGAKALVGGGNDDAFPRGRGVGVGEDKKQVNHDDPGRPSSSANHLGEEDNTHVDKSNSSSPRGDENGGEMRGKSSSMLHSPSPEREAKAARIIEDLRDNFQDSRQRYAETSRGYDATSASSSSSPAGMMVETGAAASRSSGQQQMIQ